MEGSIRIAKMTERTVITLRGLLDQELAFSLTGIASKTEPPVVLNLKQVPHITIAGSFAILSFYQSQKQRPGIQHANADVISLLRLSGTAQYVNFLPSEGRQHEQLQD